MGVIQCALCSVHLWFHSWTKRLRDFCIIQDLTKCTVTYSTINSQFLHFAPPTCPVISSEKVDLKICLKPIDVLSCANFSAVTRLPNDKQKWQWSVSLRCRKQVKETASQDWCPRKVGPDWRHVRVRQKFKPGFNGKVSRRFFFICMTDCISSL